MATQPAVRVAVCAGVGGYDYAAFGPDFRNTVVRYTKPLKWKKVFTEDRCGMVLVFRRYYDDIPAALIVRRISDDWTVVTLPSGNTPDLPE